MIIRHARIPLRVVFPLALLVFTLILSLWSLRYNGRLSDQEVERRSTLELTGLLTRLQITIEHAYHRSDLVLVQREFAGLSANPDFTCLVLFDEKGTILASNRLGDIGTNWNKRLLSTNQASNQLILNKLHQVKTQEAGQVYLTEDRLGLIGLYPILLGHNPKELREPIRGFFLISESLNRAKHESFESVKRQVLQFSIVLGVFTIILAIFFDQLISRRIWRMVQVTEEIGKGNLEARTELTGYDELGRLANSLDQMSVARQNAEARLLKLNRAVEQSPVSIIITDLNGYIEYANPQVSESTGFERIEIVGQNPNIFKSGQHDHFFYERLWNEITAGRQWRGEMHNKKKNGELFWESVTISPIFDDAGRITNFLGVKEDITDKKLSDVALEQARADAEAANLAKTNFLATMSHELRTPMNGILGIGQIMAAEEEDPEKREFIDVIIASAKALVQVLDEVLDITRIEAGHLSAQPEPCDIKAILSNLVTMFWAGAKAKNLTLVLDDEEILHRYLELDASLVTKVLSNLLANAIKFTPKGEVRLKAISLPENQIRLEVSDTGVGIPEGHLEQIFATFTQADSSPTRRYGGIGLGLAIAKNLITFMNGTIGVRSIEGKGSLFWFEIPVLTVSPNQINSAPDHREALRPIGPGHRVLVAEDDSINASVIRRILTKQGFVVLEAENGMLALDRLLEESVDLVLMDCLMPILDGYQTAKKIRQLEAEGRLKGRLPIIAVTAKAMEEDRARCLEAGMDDYVSKPIEVKLLLRAMEKAIHG
ncbi:MAG: hypothetical protein A2508_04925 [Candidatus Lambdaproteobacteria bacterium RIFOXYD12_FULL_49_8]|uniref:histidine kinase n=1 Tax=Candidatus Lambdaproteobacteria bacterium RIFOXYD2_FULL_50_16 TaxID=1817772 RepID=A0A1F6G7M1_9PROT|nr:MAG: hypothetical protein A2527_09615 [Candidatus Lambdaproteobacteria bacterium RIFOXYD2_FULL_50_16]OGG96136.1 MAG: hypothetical protein A2508_04925 [Candidatus Lambdaproteobacteria bacterium RIFOXYD12_FULL_49_8]